MAAKDPLYGVKPDGRGQHNVIPITDFRKQTFLHWLCTPPKEREPKTQELLASQLGIGRETLSRWKEDKEFLEAWEKLYLKTIGNPERKQKIMDTLYKTATDPDDPKHVQAAKQYFEIEGSVKPAKMQVEVTKSASNLTDEELDEILAQKIASVREDRKGA